MDYILSPEAVTALEIARFIEHPGLVATEEFGRGLVQMRQVRIAASFQDGSKALKHICPPGCGVLLGAISRHGETFVPHGESTIRAGDLLTLIGRKDSIAGIVRELRGTETKADRVVIMGGGSIGMHLARLVDNRQRSVKLFDWDLERCNLLAARLKHVEVVCRDATTRLALEQEHVDNTDLFIATTNVDEHNIMACVLVKEVGASRSVAVVHQPDFAPLVYRLGVDHAVTPRATFANRILRLVRQRNVSTLAVLDEGQVEIIEFSVSEETPITGKKLIDIKSRFPKGALVATILRGNEVIVPSGEDRILVGDSIVMIAALDSMEAVRKLFKR